MAQDENFGIDGKVVNYAEKKHGGSQHDSELGGQQHHILADKLARKLSARQVQMIAIGGTIGTN